MTNPKQLISNVQPEVLKENKMIINSFLVQTYSQAKLKLKDGVIFIGEKMLFVKEEFSFFYDNTEECLTNLALPVNNFLKDLTQIEAELMQEVSKESTEIIFMNGKMVPVHQVLSEPMEENY